MLLLLSFVYVSVARK